jgi:hypothetical protein
LRFYFPLHAGVEIRLFNMFHGFEFVSLLHAEPCILFITPR